MYQGDYTPAKSVVFNFNTASFSDGSPITLAGSPALSVYKNSTTESTAGITLTVDYDSRTGMHHVVIDTSADGTFYAAGNDFDVVITTGTVGGTSVVGRKVGSFSLSNRSALRPATADRTLVVDTAGLADANAVKWVGGTIPAVNVTGVPLVDAKYLLGTVFPTPATAGIIDVNVKNINNVVAATPGELHGLTILNDDGIMEGVVSLDMGQYVPTSNTAQTVGDALNAARAQGFGKWTIVGTTMTLYANDGTTAVRTFTLDSATAPTSRT